MFIFIKLYYNILKNKHSIRKNIKHLDRVNTESMDMYFKETYNFKHPYLITELTRDKLIKFSQDLGKNPSFCQGFNC